MMTTLLALAFTAQLQATPVQATPAEIQTWYEAGDDLLVVQATEGRNEPRVIYLGGLAHARLEQFAEAARAFERLAAGDEMNAWTHVGRSAVLLQSPDTDESDRLAEEAAGYAVELDPELAIAHYQHGLTFGRNNNFEGAAVAFETAATLDPLFAYAHYYGGLASYRVRQTTKMAVAFENFLKVAPAAPERAQVESTMRTLRGR